MKKQEFILSKVVMIVFRKYLSLSKNKEASLCSYVKWKLTSIQFTTAEKAEKLSKSAMASVENMIL